MLTTAIIAETLIRLGWMGDADPIADAIKRFQAFYGIADSGDVDPITERALVNRVLYGCGNSDAQQTGNICKWGTVNVSYFVARTPSGLTPDEARDAYRRAWTSWEEVCGLKVTEVKDASRANVVMDVGRGRRSDFDGPSGVLAWSQMPCGGGQQLLQRYDLDESFGLTAAGGRIVLENVACHEIGHAIGISHIAPSMGQALMNPTYSSRIPKPLELDIAEATRRYGKSTGTPPTPPPNEKQVTITIKGFEAIEVNGKPLVV